jgi:hypothetical protein
MQNGGERVLRSPPFGTLGVSPPRNQFAVESDIAGGFAAVAPGWTVVDIAPVVLAGILLVWASLAHQISAITITMPRMIHSQI